MHSVSAKGFVSMAVALAMALVTSLAQHTHDIQSATECEALHVTQRLDDVTERLTRLRSDVMLALRSATSGQSVRNCHCEAGNVTRLQADVAFIRRTVETLNIPRRSPTNHSAQAAAGDCYVDVRSYGCNDGLFKGGHIRVNWTIVQSITTTGVFLALVDPVTCTGRPFPLVNTAGGGVAAANMLVNYLNIVSKGQVLVGATGHEPRSNLQSTFAAFAEYGVNITSLQRCGKFAFIALKGSPEKTVSVVKASASGNAWFFVKLFGSTQEDISFLRLNP